MSLRDQGFRFVCRGPRDFRWCHRLEMQPSDIDCTDMPDTDFEAMVISHYEITMTDAQLQARDLARYGDQPSLLI